MSTWPGWVKYDWRDMSDAPEPVVARADMERGIPKQRRENSDARVELPLTLYFDNTTEIDDFETFFFTTIHAGQDFFDFTHPRTGAALQARVVGGSLGPLRYLNRALTRATRQVKLEYWRTAY